MAHVDPIYCDLAPIKWAPASRMEGIDPIGAKANEAAMFKRELDRRWAEWLREMTIKEGEQS